MLNKPGVMLAATSIALGTFLASCAGSETAADEVTDDEARAIALKAIQDRAGGVESAIQVAENFGDYLPSQHLVIDGQPPVKWGSGLAFGNIENVEPLSAYAIATAETGEELGGGVAVPFDSDKAAWRVVRVQLTVQEAWGLPASTESIEFALPVSSEVNPAVFSRGIESLDTVIVALTDETVDEASGEALPGVAENGAALGVVQGSLVSFPAMDNSERFVGDLNTVAAIEQNAKKPQPHIVIRGQEVVRR